MCQPQTVAVRMPVMMVGVYCRKIAKPAPDKIGIGLTRAIEMIAPKTDRSHRHGATEVARDDIVGPRIEGLEFGTRGTRESASSKKKRTTASAA
jgi:hypothetical protein